MGKQFGRGAAVALALTAGIAFAQPYPGKPVTLRFAL